MNPLQAAANRTARLTAEAVAEAKRPVYTTETKREHISAVQIEFEDCGTSWSHMPDSEVTGFIGRMSEWESVSDVDHSAKCWCNK